MACGIPCSAACSSDYICMVQFRHWGDVLIDVPFLLYNGVVNLECVANIFPGVEYKLHFLSGNLFCLDVNNNRGIALLSNY